MLEKRNVYAHCYSGSASSKVWKNMTCTFKTALNTVSGDGVLARGEDGGGVGE